MTHLWISPTMALLSFLGIALVWVLPSVQAQGLVTFHCPPGQTLIGTHCYNFVNVTLDFMDARDVCDKYGASLVSIRDVTEANDVAESAQSIFNGQTDHFWVLNGNEEREGVADVYDEVKCHGLWQPDQPQRVTVEKSAVASDLEGRWRILSVWTILPFVCRSPACPENHFRCNDGSCINNRWRCDGEFDCSDMSDEIDCPGLYSGCMRNLPRMGSESITPNYEDNSNCLWIINGLPGDVMKIEFEPFNLESGADHILVYTGGLSVQTSELLADLSGLSSEPTVLYGRNHLLIVRLVTDSSSSLSGLEFQWGPDELLARGLVEEISVTDSLETISTPYFETEDRVLTPYKKEWLFKAPEGEIINLQVLQNNFVDDEDTTLITHDGFQLNKPDGASVIISSTNQLRLMVKTTGKNRKLRATVTRGCSFSTNITTGTLDLHTLPADIECSWVLTNPQGDTLGFMVFDTMFHDNDDSLEVHAGTQATDSPIVAISGTGTTYQFQNITEASSLLLIYRSNAVRSENMIHVRFASDCSGLNDTAMNVTSGSQTVGENYIVLLECVEGYSFLQQEYNEMNMLYAMCRPDGTWFWSSEEFTRFPTCQIVYCGIPPPIENGFIDDNSGSVTFGATASYRCSVGFQSVGDETVTCQANGTWSSPPTCEADNCTEVPPVQNSNFSIVVGSDSLNQGTIVRFVCHTGYELRGPQQIVCLQNQTWSHDPPECAKLSCPLPEVSNGFFQSTSLPLLGDVVVMECNSGYMNNRTSTATFNRTCTGTRELSDEDVFCIDIDECDTSMCESVATCVNYPGSFDCECPDGYVQDFPSCEVETLYCAENRSGCDQQCIPDLPFFTCDCDVEGYILYTADGMAGYNIPDGENGTRLGDVYHINHTCVRQVCTMAPSAPTNGQVLTTRSRFLYQETVAIICDLGFQLVGQANATCNSSGLWDYGQIPGECQELSCVQPAALTPDLEISRSPPLPENVPVDGSLVIRCMNQAAPGAEVNRTMFCTLDPANPSQVTLQGDNPRCPEVDCGLPRQIPGAMNMSMSATTYGNNFTVVCDASKGFESRGVSALGNDVVPCQRNGRWGYNNLTCVGTRCSDPGTRAGTVQDVRFSYEIDQSVYYNCTRDGYAPDPPEPLVCVFSGGTANWTGSAPICKDVEPPVITCPENQIVELYSTLMYSSPQASDNSGYTCVTREGPSNGHTVSSPVTITFTASDGNLATNCSFTVELRDRSGPMVTCGIDEFKSIDLYSESVSLNASSLIDFVFDFGPDSGELTFQPPVEETIQISDGDYIPIRARVSKNDIVRECASIARGISRQCTNETLGMPEHGRVDTCILGMDSLECTIVCDDGYLFQSTSPTAVYTCTLGSWSPSLPVRPCLKVEPAAYSYAIQMLYTIDGNLFLDQFSSDECTSSFQGLLENKVATSTLCNDYEFSVLNFFSMAGWFDRLDVTFNILVTNNDGNETALEECRNILSVERDTIFSPDSNPTTSVAGEVCFTPWVLQPPSVNSHVLSEGFRCNSINANILFQNSSCLPCGPGMFSNETSGECQPCQDGYFQDTQGQRQCTKCSDSRGIEVTRSHEPRTSAEQCFTTCFEGFTSNTGYLQDSNCTACPLDTYWTDPQTCTPCPNGGSTLGIEGATNVTMCAVPCQPGSYSTTGYAPCAPCPRNFYSTTTAAQSCLECDSDKVTNAEGSSDSMECEATPCEDNFCNAEGTNGDCSLVDHRPVCPCREGYSGDSCDIMCDPCSSNPCFNGAVCHPDGLNFTCQCRTELNCIFNEEPLLMYAASEVYNTITSGVMSVGDCEDICETDESCLAYIYEAGGNICHSQSEIHLGTESRSDAKIKNCTAIILFDGEFCENDLVDDCKADTCAERNMCVDLLNDTKCVCPLEGLFNDKCESPSDLCSTNPCGNGATCTSFDSVRYVCECPPGFTGDLCETNIDECELNPSGCLHQGQCQDIINSYSCNCTNGFSGPWCQVRPDFCSMADCNANSDCYNDYVDYMPVCICGEHYQPEHNVPSRCVPIAYCSQDPCVANNTDRCQNIIGRAICICKPGFEGSLCQHNIDDCASNPCKNGGTCLDDVGTYSCTCATGFEGETCDTNTNDCPGTCDATGTDNCEDLVDGFLCHCASGFTGQNCTEDVDECLSDPCQHGGNCTNLINAFSCSCPLGWTGNRCENVQDYCSSANPCANSGTCHNLIDGTYCQCREGTVGETCLNTIDVCAALDNFTCVHGRCEPQQGSAVCMCDSEQFCEMESEPYILYSPAAIYASLESGVTTVEACQELCIADEDCKSIIYEDIPELCHLFTELHVGSPEKRLGFEKVCTEIPRYDGVSCELEKYFCQDDVCNGGECIQRANSFDCLCDQVKNVEGDLCQVPVDLCKPSTCPDGSSCETYLDSEGYLKAMCSCGGLQTYAGGVCKDVDRTFDLYFLPEFPGTGRWVASENGFSVGSQPSITVTLWVLSLNAVDDLEFSALALVSSKDGEASNPFLTIHNNRVSFRNDSSHVNRTFGTHKLTADQTWHFVSISWGTGGQFQIIFDFETLQEFGVGSDRLPFSPPEDEFIFVYLGQGFTGYISQVSVWKSILSSADAISIYGVSTNVPQVDDLVFAGGSFYPDIFVRRTAVTSAASDISVCDIVGNITIPQICPNAQDKTAPTLKNMRCNETQILLTAPVTHQVTSKRLGYLFTDGGMTSLEPNSAVVTFGAFDIGVTFTDPHGNTGVCMTRTYVTPKECSETVFSDDVSQPCADNDQGIEVTCPVGQAPSVPTPRFLTCGGLGSFNLENFLAEPDRIVCGDSVAASVTVVGTLSYSLGLECANRDQAVEGLRVKVEELVADLDTNAWPELCSPSCSNVMATARCLGGTLVEVNLTISELSELLTPSSPSLLPLTPLELMITTVADDGFDASSIAAANLNKETVEFMETLSCDSGSSLLGSLCVQCGPGSHYDLTDEKCKLCELGSFTESVGQMACQPCPGVNTTTLYRGSSNSSTDCVEQCPSGSMYNITSGSCQLCFQNFYQEEEGRSYCLPCPTSHGTERPGSTQLSQCVAFCSPGLELKGEECVPCLRGFFRQGELQDPCRPCPDANFTTRGNSSDSQDDCSIPTCPPGQYVDESGIPTQCTLCDYGFYQPEVAQFTCLQCPSNHSTRDRGAHNQSLCEFFCPAGEEEYPVGSQTCRPCRRGFYHTYIRENMFENCTACADTMTTEGEGSITEDQCSIRICLAGTYRNASENVCYPCAVGSYQEQALQDSCIPCPTHYSTEDPGSSSQEACRFVCDAGSEVNGTGDGCFPCPRGMFKDETMRFENCSMCPDDMTTTLGEGSDSEDLCNIKRCERGYILSNDSQSCIACPLDTYQPIDLPLPSTVCLRCEDGKGTMDEASTDATECQTLCDPGSEVNGTGDGCSLCPRGTFKNATMRFMECRMCPDNTITTLGEGSQSEDSCNIKRCERGYILSADNQSCDACPMDTYQPIDLPLPSTDCLRCEDGLGTVEMASTNSTACQILCDAGSEVNGMGDGCSLCLRGTFKNAAMRFMGCRMCPDNTTTTLGEGSQSEDSCNIKRCERGYILSNDSQSCVACPLDTYQPIDLPLPSTVCLRCEDGKGTMDEASTDATECQILCDAGSEVNGTGDGCSLCPRGTFKNATMRFMECRMCPDNTITTLGEGSQSEDSCNIKRCERGHILSADNQSCDACPPDSYQPIDLPLPSTVCLSCEDGMGTVDEASTESSECQKFCLSGYEVLSSDSNCTLCARGTWNNGNATMRFLPCQPCPADYTTEVLEGATHVANCSLRDCPPGSFFDASSGDACVPCLQGFYQPLPRQIACNQCPNNTNTRDTGTILLSSCTVFCPIGEEDDGNETCVPCQDDFFKSEASFGPCTQCTGDVTSSPTNRQTCADVFCDLGRELKNMTCGACDMGFYKNSRGNTPCEACPGNTTTVSSQTVLVSECSVTYCEAGFYSDDNTTCLACPEGTYKSDRGNQACTPCQGRLTTGGIASTDSANCSLNVCYIGEFRNMSNVCLACPIGEYQPLEGQTVCEPCADNFTTLQENSTSANDCRINCPAGKYRNDTVNECFDCAKGTYQASMGATSCDICEGNYTTDSTGASDSNFCYVVCSIGYVRESRTQCVACGLGTFQSQENQVTCTPCGLVNSYNSSTLQEASTSDMECLPVCPAGMYLDVTGRTCVECAIGFYNDQADLSTECVECNGTTTNAKGATSIANCTFAICEKGSFRSEGSQVCELCPKGSYQNQADIKEVTECTLCPNGTTTHITGATDPDRYCILECPDGQEYRFSSSSCQPCPIGQFRRRVESDTCQYCPSGFTTLAPGASTCLPSETPPTPSPVNVAIQLTVIVSVGECSNPAHVQSTIISIILQLLLQQSALYSNALCNSDCSNANVVILQLCTPMGTGRRRRQAVATNVEVTVNDVATQVARTDTSLLRDTTTVLEEAFLDVRSQQDTLDTNQLGIQSVSQAMTSCQEGYFMDQMGNCAVCPAGRYLDVASRTCVECAIGFYNDQADLSTECVECDGTTTNAKGATSIANCTFAICEQGSFRSEGSQECELCPKGSYQDQANLKEVTECTPCPNGMTTHITGATDPDRYCVLDCPDGQEYRFSSSSCQPCPIGQFRRRVESDTCQYCPSGFTTLAEGASTCLPSESPPTEAPVNVAVRVTVIVLVGECSNPAHVQSTIISIIRSLLLQQSALYSNALCNSDCTNVNVVILQFCTPGSTGRRRRQAGTTNVEVTINDVSTQVASTGTSVLRDTTTVLEEAFLDVRSQQETLDTNQLEIASVAQAVVACQEGFFADQLGNCAQCSAGQFCNGSSASDCPLGTYSSSPAQTTCQDCPDGQTTQNVGSVSSSNCDGPCAFDATYCGNFGTCNTQGSVSRCECSDTHEGDRCQDRLPIEHDSDNTLRLVGGISGGVAAFLLILLLIFGICAYKRRQRKKKAKKHRSLESESEFIDYKYPFYSNAALAHDMHPGDPTMYATDVIDFYNTEPYGREPDSNNHKNGYSSQDGSKRNSRDHVPSRKSHRARDW